MFSGFLKPWMVERVLKRFKVRGFGKSREIIQNYCFMTKRRFEEPCQCKK